MLTRLAGAFAIVGVIMLISEMLAGWREGGPAEWSPKHRRVRYLGSRTLLAIAAVLFAAGWFFR